MFLRNSSNSSVELVLSRPSYLVSIFVGKEQRRADIRRRGARTNVCFLRIKVSPSNSPHPLLTIFPNRFTFLPFPSPLLLPLLLSFSLLLHFASLFSLNFPFKTSRLEIRTSTPSKMTTIKEKANASTSSNTTHMKPDNEYE